MSEHIIEGEFQSDKYPWCKRGFVPLKITDPMAQKPLYAYAQKRREVDEEFSNDLFKCLCISGYVRPEIVDTPKNNQFDDLERFIPTRYKTSDGDKDIYLKGYNSGHKSSRKEIRKLKQKITHLTQGLNDAREFIQNSCHDEQCSGGSNIEDCDCGILVWLKETESEVSNG